MNNREANNSKATAFSGWRPLAFPPAVILLLLITGLAQDNTPPLPVDPTPLEKLITQEERALLTESRNPKKLVETYLDISDAHIDLAYAYTKEGKIGDAEREMDIFSKAVSKATLLAFSQQGSKRSLAKKIEQRLYKQLRTLDNMIRLFPPERAAFAARAITQAKQLRVQALNETFASGEVLDDPAKEKKPEKQAPEKDGSGQPGRLMSISFFAPVSRTPPQVPGDYMTEEEDDLVRQAQKADDRIKVFMKIADRRLEALAGTGADSQLNSEDKKAREKADKEVRNWGALPKLTRVQLLQHYSKTIDEAMAKLEDAHERNPKSSALPKALVTLRDATDRHLLVLRSLETGVKGESEGLALKAAISRAELANQGAKDGLKQAAPGPGV
ncbi:MAG TPA: hypothetical protein VNH22_00820 [Blastocatellia bacterium]|jgi:hypothetical protein|nr:hypothetical protein [Blastocatellia bacterium]